MGTKIEYRKARALLLDAVTPVERETVPLEEAGGRVLAQALTAREPVPPFDRSPYDGYAVRAADTQPAAVDRPVVLTVAEEIPAGTVARRPLEAGCAAKILTGAPIPLGADAVIPFERTSFTAESVTLTAPVTPGSNIIRAGEDVRPGQLLAPAGTVIDGGLAGVLAAQGVGAPQVFRRPRVGILSTGSEVAEISGPLAPGLIRDSNRYALAAAVTRLGCQPVVLGRVRDDVAEIGRAMEAGLDRCDVLLLTGGVSVGDYDLTPRAMELVGARVLVRGVALKPGMACAYAIRGEQLLCGLSGNPASALTNFWAVAAPVLRRLSGLREVIPPAFPVELARDYPKASPCLRMLRGRLDLSTGRARLRLETNQGNGVLSSAVGCDVMAEIPAGSGPLAAGTVLQAFPI